MTLSLNNSKIHCTIHEDNQGTIEIAKEYRIRPRTKHINVKYWHFNQFMRNNQDIMHIQWISTQEQLADIFTKALNITLHYKFASLILGWKTIHHDDATPN